jgi:hypothetical protein
MNANREKDQQKAQHARSAPLRVGLIAGLVLGVAMAAQQASGDPLGLMIVMIGFLVAGTFASREALALTRRQGVRAGFLGGVIAGAIVALAFIAASLVASLDTERTARLQQESLRVMDDALPGYAKIMRAEMERDPAAFRLNYMISTVLATTCCSLFLPAMGASMGAMGGTLGAGQPQRDEDED